MPYADLDTPRLLLDRPRLARNAAMMRARCEHLGVALRPHFKTAKSLEVARLADNGTHGPITVSTMAEAEHVARAGWRDILYAVAMAPAKLPRAAALQRETGATLRLVLDTPDAARLLAARARELDATFTCLIELDCGEHRSGVAPPRNGHSEELVAVADAIARTPALHLAGVMTHAGHSYAAGTPADIRAVAESERAAAADAATMLRAMGHPCPIVSVGSTPTILNAEHLHGVTEARAGIYLFWDLAQLSRGVCHEDQLAASVLSTVIGHQPRGPALVLDAGALALTKDLTANAFLPDAGYGWVCDATTLERLPGLSVTAAYQEHGMVPVPDATWFDRLPVGSLVRVLPNHACLTCAAYPAYDVVENGAVVDRWDRMGGW